MPDYRALYFKLFAAIADATEELELGNSDAALEILIAIQRKAEEVCISED